MRPTDSDFFTKIMYLIKRYLKIWLKTSLYSVQTHLATRGASIMFIFGKLIRFFFFIWLLLIVGGKQQLIGGYNLRQMITFFLIFNLYDIVGQVLFRGIYSLRGEIVSGNLDFRLIKPLNALFQVLTANTDLLDLPLLVVILCMLEHQGIVINLSNGLIFSGVTIIAFFLILAIHTTVAAVGILSTEVDNLVMIYRDVSSMARIPVDLYIEPIRAILTFVIPVGIIMTFPAKALMGLLSWPWLAGSFLISGIFLWGSLRFWQYALKQYSSASS